MITDGSDYGSENSSTDHQSDSSSSLLDFLIKTEDQSDEPDPLDSFGNIGEAVIVQFAESFGMTQDLMDHAFNMFGESLINSNISSIPQKRKHTRRDIQKLDPNTSTISALSSILNVPEAKKRRSRRNDFISGFSPRINSDCSETFQKPDYAEERIKHLHDTLENDRNKQFEDSINKETERLLQNATKIYGPKEWTPEEKTEFSSYYRTMREGVFSEEDKMNLQNFYAKAYQQEYKKELGEKGVTDEEAVKDILASKYAICCPIQSGLFSNSEEKEEKIKEESPINLLSDNLGPTPLSSLYSSMKYEKEKEFRYAANNIFLNVFQNCEMMDSTERSNMTEQKKYVENIKELIGKLNEFMNEEEWKWSNEDAQKLASFYDLFKERMHFTILQSKELGRFIRKVYGKLEQYELERENNTELQKKRKYWQEYKKTQASEKKEKRQANPVRPYVRSNIFSNANSESDKKLRKAAYLRQWRLAQKEKAKNQFS